jgi:hypothetical protein
LVYANDVNILVGSVQIIKKSTETFVVVSKGADLKVNADKTTYTVMSRDQNAGRTYGMKIDNSFLNGWNSSIFWDNFKLNSMALVLRANYTDRAAAAGRRS